jgi:hypothetical protein
MAGVWRFYRQRLCTIYPYERHLPAYPHVARRAEHRVRDCRDVARLRTTSDALSGLPRLGLEHKART